MIFTNTPCKSTCLYNAPSLGKPKGGLTNGFLSPKFSEKIGGEILPGKSGLFGANWRHFRAGRGLFGADRDQFLCTPQPRGKSRNCPERALFGPIGPFRAKPPFAKPPFGFPRLVCTLGGHLKPVTLKPVIRIFRIFRVFASAFSAFSAFLLCGISSDPCFSGVRRTFRIFRIFPVSVSNRWFRKSDRPALGWPALGDRE